MIACQKCGNKDILIRYVYGLTTEEALIKGHICCDKCKKNKDKIDKENELIGGDK